jgi:hypothetical protein
MVLIAVTLQVQMACVSQITLHQSCWQTPDTGFTHDLFLLMGRLRSRGGLLNFKL